MPVRRLILLTFLNASSSSSLLLSIFLDRMSSAHVSVNHADEEQKEEHAANSNRNDDNQCVPGKTDMGFLVR